MKQFSIGLVAIIMAIAFAAFTMPKTVPVHPATNNNYRYMLSNNSGDTNPLNYVYTTNLIGCDGSNVVCIIDAPGPSGSGAHPSFASGTDPYNNSVGVSVISEKP